MAGYDAQFGRSMPDDPERWSADVESDADNLQRGLSGLAGMVGAALGVEEALTQIASFARQAIPGADGTGVTLVHHGDGPLRVETWGATDDDVRHIDLIQYELVDEGPCVTCMRTRRVVVSGSLGSEQRWPRFGGRVARLGVHSALSLPLIVQDEVIGAINTYARRRDAFTEHSVRLGELFAGPAAVAVHNTRVLVALRAKADQLQTALTSRAVIDQAIGIIRSRAGGTSDEAFARLTAISQAENVRLAVVAERTVAEAVRRAHARHNTSEPAGGAG